MTDNTCLGKHLLTASSQLGDSLDQDVLRWGPRTSLLAAVLLALQLYLCYFAQGSILSAAMQIWVAAMWAGWSASVWVLVRQPMRIGRVLILGAALAWHCLLMGVARGQPAERYFIMLSSFGILQTLLATVLHLPVWQSWREPATRLPPRAQFNIISLIVITTIVAGMMVAIRRYGPQVDDRFLPGTLVVTSSLVMVATLAMIVGSRRRGYLLGLPLVTAAGLVAAAIAAASEPTDIPPSRESAAGSLVFNDFWLIYGTIIVCFGWLLWGLAACGRADALQKQTLQQRTSPSQD
jgi:hypothetical protein